MNSVTLAGNLGAPADVRFTARGQKVANLRLAVEDRHKTSSGEWSGTTDWFTVVAWGRLADIAEGLTKGARLVVAGKLKTRSWDDAGGKRRTTVEVLASTLGLEPATAAPSGPSSEAPSWPPHVPPAVAAGGPAPWPASEPGLWDEEVPF